MKWFLGRDTINAHYSIYILLVFLLIHKIYQFLKLTWSHLNLNLNFSEDKEKKLKLKKLLSIDGKSNDSMNIPVETVENITTDKPSLSHNVSMSDKTTSPSALTLQSPVVKNNVTGILNSTSNNSAEMPMTSSYSGNESDNNSSVLGTPSVTLPEGLPPSLILSIQKLIEAARKAGGDGKCKFFNMDVNRILLQ